MFIILLILLSGCGESDDARDTIRTDISVSSSTNSLIWNDSADLTLKLDIVLSYEYGAALESETIKRRIFNNDSTEVQATIEFNTEAQNSYTDSNSSNNSVTIQLTRNNINPNPQGVELNADGPGNTYGLITSVLAPGHNPIEVPDCNHSEFGDHIDEVFDADLNKHVFRFFIHVSPDNDRCINFDRQRNEIKSYGQSPDNLLGVENETVVYKWKFKLKAGFQSSPNFTHIHQLKSVGGSLESMPMYTLTTRKGTPDKLQLRYAETDDQDTVAEEELAPFIDTWLEVTETIKYSTSGTYSIEIKRTDDGMVLFQYANSSIINWRPGGSFVRPKWGIYRSLINDQDLRDEEVLFADFSITEIE